MVETKRWCAASLATLGDEHVINLFLPDIKILPLLTILRYTRNNTSDPGSSFQIAVFIKIFGAALKHLF